MGDEKVLELPETCKSTKIFFLATVEKNLEIFLWPPLLQSNRYICEDVIYSQASVVAQIQSCHLRGFDLFYEDIGTLSELKKPPRRFRSFEDLRVHDPQLYLLNALQHNVLF